MLRTEQRQLIQVASPDRSLIAPERKCGVFVFLQIYFHLTEEESKQISLDSHKCLEDLVQMMCCPVNHLAFNK